MNVWKRKMKSVGLMGFCLLVISGCQWATDYVQQENDFVEMLVGKLYEKESFHVFDVENALEESGYSFIFDEFIEGTIQEISISFDKLLVTIQAESIEKEFEFSQKNSDSVFFVDLDHQLWDEPDLYQGRLLLWHTEVHGIDQFKGMPIYVVLQRRIRYSDRHLVFIPFRFDENIEDE